MIFLFAIIQNHLQIFFIMYYFFIRHRLNFESQVHVGARPKGGSVLMKRVELAGGYLATIKDKNIVS